MNYQIGDLVIYCGEPHLIIDAQSNIKQDGKVYTYMYRLDGINGWVLDYFIDEVQ